MKNNEILNLLTSFLPSTKKKQNVTLKKKKLKCLATLLEKFAITAEKKKKYNNKITIGFCFDKEKKTMNKKKYKQTTWMSDLSDSSDSSASECDSECEDCPHEPQSEDDNWLTRSQTLFHDCRKNYDVSVNRTLREWAAQNPDKWQHPDLSAVSPVSGHTLFSMASKRGHIDVLKVLFDFGAPLSTRGLTNFLRKDKPRPDNNIVDYVVRCACDRRNLSILKEVFSFPTAMSLVSPSILYYPMNNECRYYLVSLMEKIMGSIQQQTLLLPELVSIVLLYLRGDGPVILTVLKELKKKSQNFFLPRAKTKTKMSGTLKRKREAAPVST